MTDTIVRIAVPEDARAIQGIYAPIVEQTPISFEDVTPTVQEMQDRIGTTLKNYPYLVAERDGLVIAYAYAGEHPARAAYRWSVDTSVYVGERARRSRVGRLLYERILAILEYQGFHAAFAGIALPNPGSVGLHEAVGFEFIGVYKDVGFKQGSWHDVGWWRRALAAQSLPDEPIAFAACDNHADFGRQARV